MSKSSILFVDDDPNILKALQRTMHKEPYDCYFAEGPKEALDVLHREDISLLVSDHYMPDMDGLTFLKKIRDSDPQVVRVLMTGAPELDLAIKAINEGEVYRFLTKPWNDVDLRITIRQLMDFIDLRRENQSLMDTVRRQRDFIDNLSKDHPDIFDVKRDASGAIVIDLDEV
ncbi:MAG: response regulator [Deltaproteobacteria bacterium]|nr:response regulator [Deltaproteobacteria bacterium]